MGAREINVDSVHRRVLGRFPAAAPLPRRLELDTLLQDAGTGLRWWPGSSGDEDDGYYGPEILPTLSSDTAHATDEDISAAEAARFEGRLERSVRDRRFLVLTVAPKLAARAAAVLSERFDVTTRSLERLLVENMRRVAEHEGADWDVVLGADAAAPSSDDWNLLLDLVRHHALPAVETDLTAADGTLLLTRPGLLARYDALAFFERLREQTGHAFGAWVLVPTGDPTARPTLDGHPLPVLGPGDWMAVPDAWLEDAEI